MCRKRMHYEVYCVSQEVITSGWCIKKLPFKIFQNCLENFNNELKQPSRGVFKKRCSENMQKIYMRAPMPKCDFNKGGWKERGAAQLSLTLIMKDGA